jgi:hypothetical protein
MWESSHVPARVRLLAGVAAIVCLILLIAL